MGRNERTIISAKVTITLEIFDLGTFGPGSLIEQARKSAAHRLSIYLATKVDESQVTVESVEAVEGSATSKIEVIRP